MFSTTSFILFVVSKKIIMAFFLSIHFFILDLGTTSHFPFPSNYIVHYIVGELAEFFLSSFVMHQIWLSFSWYLQIACGKRAGAFTCLLDETGRYDTPEFENVAFKPDYKVSSLAEVYSLLEANFDLIP